MTIIKGVLDPGHGGNARSNVGPTGYVEADGVLALSKLLKKELESTGNFEIYLTRDVDKTLGLFERAKIAKGYKPSFFISEHTNAGPPSARGVVTFYSVDIPADKLFAQKISDEISKEMNIRNRGAMLRVNESDKTEDYYGVIDGAQDLGIPHVLLVESAFHSDPQDEALLKTQLPRFAKAQARAICAFFGVKYAGSVPEPVKPTPQPVKPTLIVYRVILDGKQIMAISSLEQAKKQLIAKVVSGAAVSGKVQRNLDSVDLFFYPPKK